MRILVTGTSGFTGQHFQKAAQALGHEVLSLDVDLSQAQDTLAAIAASEPFDTVVHLAGISFVGHADDAAFYAVNTVGTTRLLSALAALPPSHRPSKVLVASSANVYGNCEASPIPESQPPAPTNHYAASKLAMEHLALTYLDRLPVLVARPFNYTGPGQAGSFLIPKLVDHFARRAPTIELGNLHVEREFNDVRMVSQAYVSLLCKGQPGQTYNICTGQTYTLRHVLDILETLTGHHPQVQVNPAFVRANEVHRLSGHPGKLTACLGQLPTFDLAGTLRDMLHATTPTHSQTEDTAPARPNTH